MLCARLIAVSCLKLAALLGLMYTSACGGKRLTQKFPDKIELTVGVFQDHRLPLMTNADYEQILREAEKMLAAKFGKLPLQFRMVQHGGLNDLFAETKQQSAEFTQYLEQLPDTLNFTQQQWNAYFDASRAKITKFLKAGWSNKALRQYTQFKNHDELLIILRDTWYKKLQYLRSYKLKDGSDLFSSDYRLHSYRAWLKLMQVQDKYDLILTNTIFYYDELQNAYPHVIFKHGKISGGSFESPARPGYLAGVSAMASVFELYSDEPYFRGEKTVKMKSLDRDFMNKAIGGYLLAHELGHQIYWIPDVYDHPKGCLMDTKYENLEIGDGYHQLLEHDTVCPKCMPYVSARNDLMTGHYLIRHDQSVKGVESIKRGLEKLPPVLDRDRKVIGQFYESIIKKPR